MNTFLLIDKDAVDSMEGNSRIESDSTKTAQNRIWKASWLQEFLPVANHLLSLLTNN